MFENKNQFDRGFISKLTVNPFGVFRCHHNNRVWAISSSANKIQFGVQEIECSLERILYAKTTIAREEGADGQDGEDI